jgi:hypothetical protein
LLKRRDGDGFVVEHGEQVVTDNKV